MPTLQSFADEIVKGKWADLKLRDERHVNDDDGSIVEANALWKYIYIFIYEISDH